MTRTTINLEDNVYKKLVKEALERYGTTRTLSKLINEKLKHPNIVPSKVTDVKKRMKIVEETFGAWGPGSSGKEYVRKLRRGSEKRLKRLGL